MINFKRFTLLIASSLATKDIQKKIIKITIAILLPITWTSGTQAFTVGNPRSFQGSGSALYCNVGCQNQNGQTIWFTTLAGLTNFSDCSDAYLSAFCKSRDLTICSGSGPCNIPLDYPLRLITRFDGTFTGTVQFKRNGVNIGETINLSNGIAILDTALLVQPITSLGNTDSLTAVYSGDANNAPSTTVAPVFLITTTPFSIPALSTWGYLVMGALLLLISLYSRKKTREENPI